MKRAFRNGLVGIVSNTYAYPFELPLFHDTDIDMKENIIMIATARKTIAIATAVMATFYGVSLTLPMPASADELSDLQEEAAQVSAEIDETQKKLDDASRDYDEARAREEEAVQNAQEARARQAEVEGEIQVIQERLDKRAVSVYKTDPASVMDMLLSSETFDELVSNITMMGKLNDYDRELKDEKEDLSRQWHEQEKQASKSELLARLNKAHAKAIEDEARQEMERLEGVYDGLTEEVAAILYQEQMATSYSAGATYSSGGGYGGGTTDWSGVQAPPDANDIVARAYAALGSPYAWGGVGDGGYDCSGLVSYCISGEHTRIGTTNTFMGYEQTNDPQPGDIVTSSGHCGIYIGDGQMIHASDYGTGVIIGNVQSDMIAVKS